MKRTLLLCLYFAVIATPACARALADHEESAAPNTSVTISLPLFQPASNSVFPARFLDTSALGAPQGAVAQVSGVPIGATITAVSARIQDSTTGPTTLRIAMAEQADDTFPSVDVSPLFSAGTGKFQTLTMPVSRTVVALHTFAVGVFVAAGAAPCRISSIEVTYQP